MLFVTTITGPCIDDNAGSTHRITWPAAMSGSSLLMLNGSLIKTLAASDSFRHLPSAVDMDRGTACSSMILIWPSLTRAAKWAKEPATTHPFEQLPYQACIPHLPSGECDFRFVYPAICRGIAYRSNVGGRRPAAHRLSATIIRQGDRRSR